MKRRQFIQTLGVAGAVAATPACASSSASTSALHPALTGPRMNFAQADKVMSELEIDALVLGDGVNFQQAIGVRPVVSRMGWPPPAFAVVKRGERDRLAIVTSAFSYYFTQSDILTHSGIPAYLFTSPIGDGAAALPMTFANRGETPIDSIEQTRLDAAARALDEQGTFATRGDALKRCLTSLGLDKARIAVDHTFVEAAVANATPNVRMVDANDALRRIRPVKSEIEIQLMRQAAAGNVDAALDALKTVRAGGSYRDLRAEFFAAAARRGHHGVFMVVDRISEELYDNRFQDGQAFMIDCVSEYQGYHGDYGRTVFVGEPAEPMQRATRAISDAWDKLREQLRPGLSFAEISVLGQETMKVSGKRYQVPFSPHSVGLYHSDHISTSGLMPLPDIKLEPGMVLSVDCPLLESGVGGSAHLEDLMLITKDGAEPLHPTDQQTLTV